MEEEALAWSQKVQIFEFKYGCVVLIFLALALARIELCSASAAFNVSTQDI